MKSIKLRVVSIPVMGVEENEFRENTFKKVGTPIVILMHRNLPDGSILVKGVTFTGEKKSLTLSKEAWDQVPELSFNPKMKSGKPKTTLSIKASCSNAECEMFHEFENLQFRYTNGAYVNWPPDVDCEYCGCPLILLNPPMSKDKISNV